MDKGTNRIKCDVKNCVHHTETDSCAASCIEVGCCDACDCGETLCTTFELDEHAVQG